VGFLPLRDNSFKTELAGVPKLGLAVALHVLVESNAWPSLGQDYSKRGLATLQRIRSEIVTVQFDQVEGVQENAFVMVPVANAIEQRDAVVITGNRLPVDDARARAQPGQRLDDQREAVCEVIARAAVEPHLRAVLASYDPKPIVLDLVQPLAARRKVIGFSWEARRDEPGRENTLQHVGQITFGQSRLQLHH